MKKILSLLSGLHFYFLFLCSVFVFQANLSFADCFSWMKIGGDISYSLTTLPREAIAPNGDIYVFYQDWGNGHKGTVKKFDGTVWSSVGVEGFTLNYLESPNISFDSSGTPIIAYSDQGVLCVKKFSGTTWEDVGTLPSTSWVHGVGMQIAPSGNIYVSFTSPDLSVIKYDGITWQYVGGADLIEVVPTSPKCDISIDSSEHLYVSVSAQSTGALKVMSFTSGTWSQLGSDIFAGVSQYISTIEVSPSGVPHVIYDSAGAVTVVKKFLSGAWQNVGDPIPSITAYSVSFDTVGVLSVLIADTNSYPQLLTFSGAGWDTVYLGNFEDGHQLVSAAMVIDKVSNMPVVAAFDANSSVFYAERLLKISPPSAISGPTVMCTGSTITLTDTQPGGRWSSSTKSVAVIGSSSGIVNCLSSGETTINYYLGSCSVSSNLSNPWSAGMITGPMRLRPGQTVKYSNAATPGGWSLSNTNASITPGGLLTGLAEGTVTISYTTSSVCGIAYDTLVVEIKATEGACASWEVMGSPSFTSLGSFAGAMAVDRKRRPYVFLADDNPATTTHPMHSTVFRYNGGVWQPVGSEFNPYEYTFGTSIVVDTTDAPIISLTDQDDFYKVKVFRFNGYYWQQLGDIQPHNVTAELAISTSNSLYAAVGRSGGIGYAILERWNGSSWDTVGSNAIYDTPALKVNLALAGDVPYVGFIKGTNDSIQQNNIIVKKCVGGIWSTVGMPNFTSGGVMEYDLAVTKSGMPYVIYNDVYTSDVTVMRFDGSDWVNVGIPHFTGGMAFSPGICIDSNDNVYVSYLGGAEGKPCVRKFDGTSWISNDPYPGFSGYSFRSILSATPDGALYNLALLQEGDYFYPTIKRYGDESAAPDITGPSHVMVGSSITMSVTVTGGTWTSSNPSLATIGSSDGVVEGVTSGIVNLTYTSGSCSVWTTVTVGLSPIIGSSALCQGSTTSLTSSTVGGIWMSSNTTIATIDSTSGVLMGVSAGTAEITYSIDTLYTTKIITINLTPNAGVISGIGSLCESASTTLTNTVTSGTWSSGATSVAMVDANTGVVAGVTPGTATITYAVTNSCGAANATTVVTVNALASAGTLTGVATVCPGNTMTLNSTVSGGTWISGAAGVASVDGTSGVVTGVAAGTARITYSVTNSCNTASTSVVVTVNAAPAAGTISGATSVCTSATTTLTNTVTGGTWTSGATGIAAVDVNTGVVTGVSAGTAMITYVVTNSCGTANAATEVTVNALASAGTLTGVGTVCPGNTTTLNSTVSGGTWTSGAAGVAGVDGTSGVVTGAAAGTARITYSVTNSCNTAATSAVITVNAAPAAGTISGANSVCASATTTLTSTVSGGMWSSGATGVATVGASSGVVNGVGGGVATITYAVTNGCGTATATTNMTVSVLPSAGIISGVSTLCTSATGTLSSTVGGGTWSSGDGSVATVGSATGVVAGVSAGTARITYTVSNSCGSAQTTVVVTVTNLPSAGVISGAGAVCQGATIGLSSTVTGGTWSSSNTGVAGVNSGGMVTGIAAGAAIITYHVTGSCGMGTATATVTVNALPAPINGNMAVCGTSSTVLSTATTGGVWSSGNTAIATINSSGVVTGTGTGTVLISYTGSNGCVRTATVNVGGAPAITGTASLCPGTITVLSPGAGGGSWMGGSQLVATVTNTGVVTGIGAGSTVISYMIAPGCSASIIVTVNPLPAAIAGTLKACPGTSTLLGDMTVGGSWSSGNESVATVNPVGKVMGVTAGTVNISYTTAAGCSRTAIVTVNPVPAAITGSLVVCPGLTSSLSDATPGMSWASGNTAVATIGATTGVLVGVSAGTALITYTAAATNCSVTTIATVATTPAVIGGATTACVGSTATLTNSVPGGTWSSAAPAFATVDVNTGVVTGLTIGNVIMSYSVGAGCYKTKTISVVAAAPAIAGYTTVCQGLTTTLTAASGTWASSNAAIANVIMPTAGYISGTSVGAAAITFTNSAGCYSTTTVNVIPVPGAITGTTAICSGQSTILANASAGGSWSSSNIATATVGSATGVVNAVGSAGTVTITYAYGSTCRATTTFTVRPLPAVISGTPTVCATSGATTLSDATSGGTWSSSNASVATVGTVLTPGYLRVTGVSAGNTIISYTLSATECARGVVVTVNACSRPMGNVSATGFWQLYPNPTSGGITVESAQGGVLHVYSLDGKEVASYVIGEGMNNLRLPKELAAGVYMCRFISERGEVEIVRLVVE